MGWLLANFLLFLYVISPMILTLFFGVAVLNGGRGFEIVGIACFLAIFIFHIVALNRIRKCTKTKIRCKMPSSLQDLILFFLQFVIVAAGITFSSINAANENLSCPRFDFEVRSEEEDNSGYHAPEFDHKKPSKHERTTETPESTTPAETFNGFCGVDVSIFLIAACVLCLRCWDLPTIVNLRNRRKKKRSPTLSPIGLDPRLRVTSTATAATTCVRDSRVVTTVSASMPIFSEGEFEPLGPPPNIERFMNGATLAPLPSYDYLVHSHPPPEYVP